MPLQRDWAACCKAAQTDLKEHVGKSFDMLMCSGISGQSVGFGAALLLKVPLLVIRKEINRVGDYRDADGNVMRILMDTMPIYEHWMAHGKAPKVCFVDDWISGGGTRMECAKIIHAAGGDVCFQYLYVSSRAGYGDGPKASEIPKDAYRTFGPVADARDIWNEVLRKFPKKRVTRAKLRNIR